MYLARQLSTPTREWASGGDLPTRFRETTNPRGKEVCGEKSDNLDLFRYFFQFWESQELKNGGIYTVGEGA